MPVYHGMHFPERVWVQTPSGKWTSRPATAAETRDRKAIAQAAAERRERRK